MNPSPSQPPVSGDSERTPARGRRFNFWRYFWLSFLVVSLGYTWYCFYAPPNNIAWAESFDAAKKQSTDSGKPMILYFTGKWCVPCRIMKRQVWADPEVASLVNGQFIPVAIDMDDPEDAELLTRYNVRGVPVTILSDAQGNALRWRAGGMSKSEFLALLRDQDPPVEKNL
jgi:protein disulfide-isomerase